MEHLVESLARPEPFAPSDAPFWDDPHISEHLLRAHLDPENPAASRPPDALAATVTDLRRSGLVEDGSRVLDLGCGPGLVATLLAAEGCRVTGVDLSRRSVEHARAEARRRGQQIEYRVQDFRHLSEEGEYDLVLQSYGELSTLSPGDLDAVLTGVRRALAPGGHLVADLATAELRTTAEPTTWSVEPAGFWRPHRHALLTTSHSYPDGVWCNQYTVVDDDGATTYRMWFTDHTPTTAATVLGRAGLRLLRCTDGLSARPWTGSGPWLGVVAEPC